MGLLLAQQLEPYQEDLVGFVVGEGLVKIDDKSISAEIVYELKYELK